MLVTFGGLRGPVKLLLDNQQFRVKVWDTDELIENLIELFSELETEFFIQIPLPRVCSTLFSPR
jgi:predicted Mrr-cat superfamily restriction endonuclease